MFCQRFLCHLCLGAALLLGEARLARACSRVYYETSNGTFLTGRSMDWTESLNTDLWAFPRGMQRDGGVGPGSIKWTSRYGSVVASAYDAGTADGLNEAGLAGNMLYLAEAEVGGEQREGQPKLSIGAWLQYALDNFGSVAEAVKELQKDQINIVDPLLPNGEAAGLHLSLSDNSNDSAILEYLGGRLVVHHGPSYNVMTNSPPFDQQLALMTYWKEVGGISFLPGTHRAADRFVRLGWNLAAAPKVEEGRPAVATVFSLIRHVSVPIGVADPEKPNIATTQWRTVADHAALRYYFESTASPSVLWVDLPRLGLSEAGAPKRLLLRNEPMLAGETSHLFEAATPFPWLRPPLLV